MVQHVLIACACLVHELLSINGLISKECRQQLLRCKDNLVLFTMLYSPVMTQVHCVLLLAMLLRK